MGTIATDQLPKQLEAEACRLMAFASVPGLSLALVVDGQLAWVRGLGVRNLDKPEPVGPDTVFEAASLTKPMVAALALLLIEAHRLELDAPLSRYLSRPYLPDEPRLDAITTRHVLSHTCGLPNWTSPDQPLKIYFPPGERFSYSGEGYLYLQRVIEQITGQTLADFAEKTLLKPLGLAHSSLIWKKAFEKDHACGHDEQNQPKSKWKPDRASAMSSLHTSANDYGRFLSRLLGDPTPLPQLRPALLEMSMMPQVMVNDLAPWNKYWPNRAIQMWSRVFWGLGWGLQELPDERIFFQWGDNFVFQAMAMGSRQTGLGLVILSNSLHGSRLWHPLFQLVFGDNLPGLDWLECLYQQE